jgi:D-sedoheptulose 7-phosphate isomerase
MSSRPGPKDIFAEALTEHQSVVALLHDLHPVLERIAVEMTKAIQSGNKILWFGNGGSAADSQHLAAEFVGRFCRERRGLPSIALTTDTSVLTSIANDYGFEDVFRRQVEAHCVKGDLVVGISTSGTSKNVCAALREARDMDAFTVAFTGADGATIGAIAHETLRIPSKSTARIQECHILCGHVLCDWVDRIVCESSDVARQGAPR